MCLIFHNIFLRCLILHEAVSHSSYCSCPSVENSIKGPGLCTVVGVTFRGCWIRLTEKGSQGTLSTTIPCACEMLLPAAPLPSFPTGEPTGECCYVKLVACAVAAEPTRQRLGRENQNLPLWSWVRLKMLIFTEILVFSLPPLHGTVVALARPWVFVTLMDF